MPKLENKALEHRAQGLANIYKRTLLHKLRKFINGEIKNLNMNTIQDTIRDILDEDRSNETYTNQELAEEITQAVKINLLKIIE